METGTKLSKKRLIRKFVRIILTSQPFLFLCYKPSLTRAPLKVASRSSVGEPWSMTRSRVAPLLRRISQNRCLSDSAFRNWCRSLLCCIFLLDGSLESPPWDLRCSFLLRLNIQVNVGVRWGAHVWECDLGKDKISKSKENKRLQHLKFEMTFSPPNPMFRFFAYFPYSQLAHITEPFLLTTLVVYIILLALH